MVQHVGTPSVTGSVSGEDRQFVFQADLFTAGEDIDGDLCVLATELTCLRQRVLGEYADAIEVIATRFRIEPAAYISTVGLGMGDYIIQVGTVVTVLRG